MAPSTTVKTLIAKGARFTWSRLAYLAIALVTIGATANADPALVPLYLQGGVTLSIPSDFVYEAKTSDGKLVKSGIPEISGLDDPMPNTSGLLTAWLPSDDEDSVTVDLSFRSGDNRVDEMFKAINGDLEKLGESYDRRVQLCCVIVKRLSIHGDVFEGKYPRTDYQFLEQTSLQHQTTLLSISRWITVYRPDGILTLRASFPAMQRERWEHVIESIIRSLSSEE